MMTCERCGERVKRVILHEKALWCQPCHEAERYTNQATAIARDEIPGGITLENYGPKPMTFYSHGERRRYMEAHGLRELEKFCPMPGTDKDPQGIPNPAGYVDPYTLEQGRILISRNGRKEAAFDGEQAGVLKELHTTTVADAAEMRKALGQS